ncbi:hypothetical protein R3Q06_26030 [Rhodococcus erythropolis]|nr:hypothetical protein [Rhodococcus erythropolis]MDV6276959.1 hypothetical protein [Rhodococcus erythropolis]
MFVEVADAAHIQSVRELPEVCVTWLPREGPGPTPLLRLHRLAEARGAAS